MPAGRRSGRGRSHERPLPGALDRSNLEYEFRIRARAIFDLIHSRMHGCDVKAGSGVWKELTSTATEAGGGGSLRNHRARSSLCPKRQIKAHFYYLPIGVMHIRPGTGFPEA